MKSGLLAAVALGSLLLVTAAAAQGVKIGILNDQSGVYADYGGKYSVEAARMAIEDFGGTVLGQKIEMVTADHQNKPDLAASIARRWYEVEGVDMITELTTSSVALAVQELSRDKKKIDIVVGAASSRLTGDACTAYGFHWAFDTHALAVGTGGALVKAGGNTWFFLTVDYAFGYALEKDTSEIVTANGGKVLGSVRIPLNSADFSSFLLQAQSSKAKILGSRQCRARYQQRDQAGGGIRHRFLGPETRRAVDDAGGSARPRAAGGAGSDPDRRLLLGSRRPIARVLRTLLQAHRPDAQHDPGRHLFGDAAISEGGQGGRHQGLRCRRQEAEGDAGRRHVRRRAARFWPTAAWCTTSICSRSRSRRSRRSRGTTTSSSPSCPATRPFRRPRTAAAR